MERIGSIVNYYYGHIWVSSTATRCDVTGTALLFFLYWPCNAPGFAGEILMRARTFESPWLGMETQSPGYEATHTALKAAAAGPLNMPIYVGGPKGTFEAPIGASCRIQREH